MTEIKRGNQTVNQTCLNCKHAEWDRRKGGCLHPSGAGRCTWQIPDITLYRDEVHNPETRFDGVCEASVVKNRHGPTGIIRLAWSKDFMRFDGLEREHDDYRAA